MKFAICQELFVDWDWERQCQFMAETGYTGIELAPFTLAARITDVSAARRRELKAIAESHGLTICGLHWLLAKTEGLHLTTADAAVRRATARYRRWRSPQRRPRESPFARFRKQARLRGSRRRSLRDSSS